MENPLNRNWGKYYDDTRETPPSGLLVQAEQLVKDKNRSLDVGGGALKDSKYMLGKGFDVTVIDKEPLILEEAKKVGSKKLHAIVTSFEDFNFPENTYDLINAMNSLPFNSPETFNEIFARIKRSLAIGGIFSGKLFGKNDEWSKKSRMTFHTIEEVRQLISDLQIILLEEKEYDGKIADGSPKHWHTISFIAKRNN